MDFTDYQFKFHYTCAGCGGEEVRTDRGISTAPPLHPVFPKNKGFLGFNPLLFSAVFSPTEYFSKNREYSR